MEQTKNIWETVVEQLKNLLDIVPNLIGAVAVILVGWIISKLVERFVRRILRSVGADKLAEKLNEIELFFKSNIRIVPSVLLSKLLYYILLFIFAIAATDVLGMEAVSDLMTNILNYLPNLISASIVFVIGIFIADFLKNIVRTTCDSLGIPASSLIANIVFYFLFLNIAMITLSQARIDTEFIQDNLSIILGGIVGAFAIGYGLASRNLVANFLSSFYNKDKIKIGDRIAIDGYQGEIVAIDNMSITLHTGDKRIIVPLSKLTSETFEVIE